MGCQSFQKDLLISSVDEKVYSSLTELEETITKLDGAGAGRDELARARQQVTALQGSTADNDFEALLAAWSGRLYLMEGRTSEAQREYRRSQSLSPYNLPSQILSFRLERDLSRRLTMIDQSLEAEGAQGELLIERGRLFST